MSRCNSCSAPLPANSNRCLYCGIRNDVDIHGKHAYNESGGFSDRVCPHCAERLQVINLQANKPLQIERCQKCFGLFFDLGELDDFLSQTASQVLPINKKHLANINKDRYRATQKVKYIQCPQCREFMRRSNFAHRSGVIVDICRQHGIWLDNGELTHLLEWRKMGGQLLHEQHLYKAKAAQTSSILYGKRQDGAALSGARADGDLKTTGNFIDAICRILFTAID